MKKLTPQQAREHNLKLVLRTIYNSARISRADIARLTNLTRATVSDVVEELMNKGFVREVGLGPSTGGKPPTLLEFVEDARYLVGVDLAEDEFRGALIDLRGGIKRKYNTRVKQASGSEALNRVYELLDVLVKGADRPILGIGIGVPGLMDAGRGMVLKAVNLDWQDLPLRDLLQERYNVSVYVANDCQVAALSEYTFGKCKKTESLVLIKIGRGVGAGVVINGSLYHGDSSGAGEIGHVVVDENGERCGCGKRGCLETFVSCRAMIRKVERQVKNEGVDMKYIFTAFSAGDERVKRIVLDAAHHLGLMIAHIIAILNIQEIVLAGGITELGEGFLKLVEKVVREHALDALAKVTRIRFASLGEDMVMMGAAAFLMKKELGLP